MASNPKFIEMMGKENTQTTMAHLKKDKNNGE